VQTQQEWVEGCLNFYKENDLQQGNPEDGVWQECHFPVPKCLGGTEVVFLLEEHHAVQGVLQSEEFQHPCVWGWERKFLEGELLSLFEKWHRNRGRVTTPEQKAEAAREWWGRLSPEEREERKWRNFLTPEERAERNGWSRLTTLEEKRRRNGWDKVTTPEEKRVRAGWTDDLTPEQRREKVGWGNEEQRKERARRCCGKPVEVLTPQGVLLTFDSLSEAEECLGLRRYSLSPVASGRRNRTKGFRARLV